MPRTKISEFSATPANNTDIDSINIAEGCAPSGINDAIRELMAQLKDFQTGAQGDSFNGPIGTSTAAAGAFTTLSASSTTTLSGLTASTALALDASKNVVSVTNTGTGSNVLATSPTLVTPILGTPTSATLTNATGLPISTGVSGLGTGVATFLATPSSANLRSALTDETGTGSAVFATSPTLVTPVLGTPTSATLTNAIGLPLTTGVTGTLPTANGGTNLTSFTSGGVVYASSTSALATGSALTFDGTNLAIGGTPNSYGGFTTLTLNNTSGSEIDFKVNGSNLGNIYAFSSGFYLNTITNVPMVFGVNSTEALRLTSTSLYTASGINVGIGTSSPSYKLHVRGTDATAVLVVGNTSEDTRLEVLTYQDDKVVLRANDTSNTARILAFETGTTERTRIDSSGNLLVGTTSGTQRLVVSKEDSGAYVARFTNTTSSNANGVYIDTPNRAGSNALYGLTVANSGGNAFAIYTDGTYGTISDINRKKNVETARDGYLADLCALRVVKYNWKEQEDSEPKNIGFIAQEVEQVFAGMVQTDNNGQKMLIQPVFIPVLVKAMQEQQAIISAQATVLESLKARLDAANL